jgi:predicted transcriptional regulator
MNEEVQTTVVTVRMDTELRDELERLAEADHRPLSNYLRVVLSQYVESVKAKEAQEAA